MITLSDHCDHHCVSKWIMLPMGVETSLNSLRVGLLHFGVYMKYRWNVGVSGCTRHPFGPKRPQPALSCTLLWGQSCFTNNNDSTFVVQFEMAELVLCCVFCNDGLGLIW